jgi:FkbM family methyltransferase
MKVERDAFKVAHFSVFAPNQCGLYHTAKDLILAERQLGIDARMIADDGGVHTDGAGGSGNGSLTTEQREWAYSADILVRHSAIPSHLQNSGKPIIMCLHGRPESSLLLTRHNQPVIEAVANKADDCRYKAFVTFWEEYVPIWKNLVGDKLHYVPACVDMDEFQPNPKQLDTPQILICDMWREDVTPFNVIFAAAAFAKKHGGKVHIAGLAKDLVKPMTMLLQDMQKNGVLGRVATQTRHIKDWYAECNILASPHVIATRAIREATACGLKVVAGSGCQWTPWTANPMDVAGYSEALAEAWSSPDKISTSFWPEDAAQAMQKVFHSVMPKPSKTRKNDTPYRKVFVDIGGHLGESVRRFYREVEDADQYEIYSFEPDPETFAELDRQVGHIPNVTLVNAAMAHRDGLGEFYSGQANDNEGGTAIHGKRTGDVQYDKPKRIECVAFNRWYETNSGDYNIVKINIEGGEYSLMDQMLEHNIVPDKVFIQLHAHKFDQGLTRQRFHETEARFWNEYPGKKFLTDNGMERFDAE